MPTTIDLTFPFTGTWLVQNSPADRVPSHGTTLFASSCAIDFVPATGAGRTAPITLASLVRPEAADRFPGFGVPILSPVDGVVLDVHAEEPDHAAYRGLPSVGYALTQRRRAAAGWRGLAGNHVLLGTGGAVVALCHLQQGSIEVQASQRVRAGDRVARCGNSGNSTEPHLHVQAMDDPDPGRANGLPITFGGTLPSNGTVVRG